MYKLMQKIPGGIIIVPMIVVSLVGTFFPNVLSYSGMTAALFSGQGTEMCVALLIFLAGTQLKLSEVGGMLWRGGVLCITRVLIAVAAFFIVGQIWGPDGFLGISLLAIVITLCSCDPGVYLAVVNEHGDAKDASVFVLLNLVVIPAVPILIMSAGQGGMSMLQPFFSSLVPFVIGFVLGNIDHTLANVFGGATPVALFFLGVNLGATINWVSLLQVGISGIWLTILYFVVSIPILLLADRLILRRPGFAAVSMTSLSGVSIIMPAAVAAVMPQYAEYVGIASAQIALAMLLSKVVSVPLNALTVKLCRK